MTKQQCKDDLRKNNDNRCNHILNWAIENHYDYINHNSNRPAREITHHWDWAYGWIKN